MKWRSTTETPQTVVQLPTIHTGDILMAKQPLNLDEMTPKQLSELIQKAHDLQSKKYMERAQHLRSKWQQEAEEEGIALIDIFPPREEKKPREKGERTPAKPKYQNPNNPAEQWSGKGRPMKWMQALLEKGHTKEEFLIEKT